HLRVSSRRSGKRKFSKSEKGRDGRFCLTRRRRCGRDWLPPPLLAAASPAVIPMAKILKGETPSHHLGFGEQPINKTEKSLNSAPPELASQAAPTESVPLEA